MVRLMACHPKVGFLKHFVINLMLMFSSTGNASTIDSIWKTGGPTTDASSETRIKAGVIAGVVSGSVVIVSCNCLKF